MKTPRLDLHRANKPGPLPGIIALVLAIVALIAAMQYRDALRTQGEALDARESAIAKRETKYKAISRANGHGGQAANPELMAQQRYATEPGRNLIEHGWRPNIAFLSVEFITESRQITLIFETRTVQEALSYADWFQAQAETESVSIKRQTVKAVPPVSAVETTMQVTWKPFVGRSGAASSTEAKP